jgi:hypothetical protein
MFQETILQRIYNQIAKADLIVADMTTRNPNVFYEVGYAHALGKPVILLTQEADDIPFDLKHYPHIIYGKSISTLLAALESRVRWHLDNKEDRLEPVAEGLAFYFGGQALAADAEVTVAINQETTKAVVVADYGVSNISDLVYHGRDEEIALIVPDGLALSNANMDESIASVSLPNKKTLHTFGPLGSLLPQAWATIPVRIAAYNGRRLAGQQFPVIARHFTEFGPRDIPFSLAFVEGSQNTSQTSRYESLRVTNQFI